MGSILGCPMWPSMGVDGDEAWERAQTRGGGLGGLLGKSFLLGHRLYMHMYATGRNVFCLPISPSNQLISKKCCHHQILLA